MNYYNEIKTELINNEITKRVKDYSKNRSDLNTYYNVGKLLSEAGKHYGEGIIKEYSEKLTNELNIKYRVVNHKAVFTMEDVINENIEPFENIVKNIFIRDDKKINYYLVLIAGNKRVNLKELRNNLRLRPLTFASEEDLEKYLGLHKGSVTVLGVLNDTNHIVKVLIDEDIKKFKEIGVHPNENTASIWLKLEDIEKILNYTENDYEFIKI